LAGKLDKIIVVDIEATCWEGNRVPKGMEKEIIEIGICLLDTRSGERSDKEAILVRPERSTVSRFCTQLTTLTQEQVDGGIKFAKALRHIKKKYRTKDRAWASYGDFDRKQFRRQCESFGLPYPFGPTHLNVKTLFALFFGLPHEVGLPHALRELDLALEGTHHRGVDDAWNTAAILERILSNGRFNPEKST
jgi:inhibitor of KinA sporulation pathway (predicted exonuclease)